jgi:6-phosphogluconate dehydrogenase
MKIGFIGLGRMGSNMVYNLLEKNHEVVVYNRSVDPIKEIEKKGAIGAYSVKELIENLPNPRIIWIMVVAGSPVDELIQEIIKYTEKGDIIIDGGNSFYKESIRRYKELKEKGISFLDCGTSGGMGGARSGACMMIGGEKETFRKIEILFRDMCVKDGYGYMGRPGAGHFIKMVHNGIEYGMMGAIAEGMQAIDKHKEEFGFDQKEVVKVYSNGSIIESRLVTWLYEAMKDEKYFNDIAGVVPRGETENEMKELSKMSPMPILEESIKMRNETRKTPTYAGKVVSTLRNKFGGHKVEKR